MRCRGLVDVEHVVGRTTAGVLPGLPGIERSAQRGIDVHRQRIFGLSGFGDLVDEVGDVPGMEEFIGIGAEYVPPVARLLAELHQQRLGDRAIERLLGQWREVPHPAVRPGLVLGLDHDHGALRVGGLQVAHQLHERRAIGLECLLAQRRQ